MSYILDALRKSDQQRQHGAAPTLATVDFAPPANSGRKWRFVAFALALLLAGMVIGWWQAMMPLSTAPTPPPPPTPDSATDRVAAASVPGASPAAPAVPERAPLQHEMKFAGMPPPGADAAAAKAVVPGLAAEQLRGESARPDVMRQPQTAADRQANPAGEPATPEPAVMAWSELPASIQQELPKLSVSLHAYSSKPDSRLVSVNDRLLHEGDSLAPGLVLEQIRPEDMVFSYKGFRFRRGIQ